MGILTLISSGQRYEAGFFTLPGSEPDKIYLGIWYYDLSDPKTVVWVANRDNPASNSSVILEFKSDGVDTGNEAKHKLELHLIQHPRRDLSIRTRLTMGPDRLLYTYTWVPESKNRVTFWYHPEVLSDKYMACCPCGVFDERKLFGCVCPYGFFPKDSFAVSLRDGTHGCVRRTGLECGADGFKVVRNMKLPMSGAATVDEGKGLEECKKTYKKDCNCTPYANVKCWIGWEMDVSCGPEICWI
ncbi:hypothetical protein V2J09_001381 [Rumex salicifolius]